MSHSVTIRLEGPIEDLGTREEIEALMDRIMEDLLDCVIDPTVSESYQDETVSLEFCMEVPDDTPEAAITTAMSALRSSLHGAGAHTPGWEELISQMRSDVRATSEDSGLVDA